jgi:hypothetical protein
MRFPNLQSSPTVPAVAILLVMALVTSSVFAGLFIKLAEASAFDHYGLLFNAFPVMMPVGALLGGIWIMRAGPRRPLATGLSLLAGATAAMALADDPLTLIAARALQSAAVGVTWMAAFSLIGARGKAVGFALSATALGTAAGPLLGTLAVSSAGTDLAFVLFAAVAGATSVLSSRLGRSVTATAHRPGRAAPARVQDIGKVVPVLALLVALAVVVPTHVPDVGFDGPIVVLSLVALAAATFLPVLWGILSDRGRPITLMGFGLGAVLLAQAMKNVPSPAVYFTAIVVFSAGATLALTTAVAWLAAAGRATESGALTGGGLAGLVVCGVAAMAFSPYDFRGPAITTIAVIGVLAMMALRMRRYAVAMRPHA